MPHRADGLGLNADQPAALDRVATGDSLPLAQLDVAESWTVPPEPLREAELIEAMPTKPNPHPHPNPNPNPKPNPHPNPNQVASATR